MTASTPAFLPHVCGGVARRTAVTTWHGASVSQERSRTCQCARGGRRGCLQQRFRQEGGAARQPSARPDVQHSEQRGPRRRGGQDEHPGGAGAGEGRVCLECKHTPAHTWGRAAEECELRVAPVSGIMYSDVWMNHLASTLGRVDKRRCPPCLPEIEHRRNCGGTIATVLTTRGRMQPHSAASDKGSSYRRAGTRTHEPPSIGAGCTMVRPCAAARMGTAIE